MKIRSVEFAEDLNLRCIDFTTTCKRESTAISRFIKVLSDYDFVYTELMLSAFMNLKPNGSTFSGILYSGSKFKNADRHAVVTYCCGVYRLTLWYVCEKPAPADTPAPCLWFKWVHSPSDACKRCYNCALNGVECPHLIINSFTDEVLNMNEKQKQMTSEFIGQVAYIIGKRGKKGAIDYLSKNTALSVKSAKAIVDSVCKLYDEGGEIYD